MKDPHDKSTIDFESLVTEFEREHDLAPGTVEVPKGGVSFGELTLLLDHVKSGLKRPVGRPPAGERALTPAEKQKAYRDRQRAAKQAEAQRLDDIRAGAPVTSSIIDLDSAFTDVYRAARGKD